MVTIIFLVLITACTVALHFEDKYRKTGQIKKPVWTPLVFKLWTVSTGLFLALFFTYENGAQLVDWIKSWGTPDFNARVVAFMATLWLLVIYGVLTYLGIIQDDDEDLEIMADAIFYDGK